MVALESGILSRIFEPVFTARPVGKFKAEIKEQVNLTSGSNFANLEDRCRL